MICTVGNTKGGVGKTTLAVNMAVFLTCAGRDVLLVDGDEQGTAMAFSEIRMSRNQWPKCSCGGVAVSNASGDITRTCIRCGKIVKRSDLPQYTAIQLHGAALRTQVRQLAGRYDYIVIDVGGRDSGSLRAALTVSHLVLIPAAPRSFDLWGVDQTADLVREAREVNDQLRAIAILNGADAAGKDNGEAMEALGDMQGLEVSPCRLGRRKAYPNAAAHGLGVCEYSESANPEGSRAAHREFTALMASLFPAARERKTA